MMQNAFGLGAMGSGFSVFASFSFLVIIAWSLAWKGIALWKAARREDKWWFIALLLINTMGILEILYILIWNKRPQVGSAPVSSPENKA